LAFLAKTNVIINILHNLPLLGVKNANFFAKTNCENISRIITSVPGQHEHQKRIRFFCCRQKDRKLPTLTVILTVSDATAASDTAQK
jgi:hypothetical protein